VTAAANAAARFVGTPGGPLDLVWSRPQRATLQIGRGQFATLDSAGYAALNDGTVGYRYPAGIGNLQGLSPAGTNDGDAWAELWEGTEIGLPQSTVAGDSFTDADILSPFFIADANTPGKLAVLSGNDRSFGGIFLGMEHGSTTIPRLLVGPIAGLLAMLLHHKDNDNAGVISYAVDGSASTDIASSANPYMIPRPQFRCQITSITIVPSAALAATSGNDAIITVVKVDTTGGVALASSPTVGTFTTTTALVAGQPAKFTLSGTAANLLLRSTDILAYYRTHNGSGAVIPQSAIMANAKVL
jgi:hypothetical protein